MPPKITEDTKQLMYFLYLHGKKPAAIAARTGVKRTTIVCYMTAWNKGYPSVTAYQNALLSQRKFSSSGAYKLYLVMKMDYDGIPDYHDALARKNGHASFKKYQMAWSRKRREETLEERLLQREQRKEERMLEHMRKMQYFSQFLQEKLQQLHKTQQWLAANLEISHAAVSRYASGQTLPKRKYEKAIFELLEVPYKTLDELIQHASAQGEQQDTFYQGNAAYGK